MSPSPQPEENLRLAAMVASLRQGNPVSSLDMDTLRLQLVDQALARGLTWATLGRLYGKSGRELKRDIHKLRAKVGHARRIQDNHGEEQ